MLNKSGLTLVEVLISLVILLFVSLALMQTALVSIEANMKNVLRDEAANIAEGRLDEMRSIPFLSVASDGPDGDIDGDGQILSAANCPSAFWGSFGNNGMLVRRNLKNVANFNFCTNRTVQNLDAINRQVTLTVGWGWKGVSYAHTNTALIRNAAP